MKTLYLLLYRYRLNNCEPYERKKWLTMIGDLKKEMDTQSFEYKFKVFQTTWKWPLMLIFCFSCIQDVHVPIKPFYIIKKDQSDYLTAVYTCVDSKGIKFEFTDGGDKYSIGDSIK